MAMSKSTICDVCEQNAKGDVLSSGLGPASFYYCKDCQAQGAEPFGVVAIFLKSQGLENIAGIADAKRTWKDGIYLTLREAAHTYPEEMEAAIAAFFKSMT